MGVEESERIGRQIIDDIEAIQNLAVSTGTLEYIYSIMENLSETHGLQDESLDKTVSEELGIAVTLLKGLPIRNELGELYTQYGVDEIGGVQFDANGEQRVFPIRWPEDITVFRRVTSQVVTVHTLFEFLQVMDLELRYAVQELLSRESIIDLNNAFNEAMKVMRAPRAMFDPKES